MVAVPAPAIVAAPASLIFTTLLLLLVNVKDPDEREVGFPMEKAASPNVFDPPTRAPNAGNAGLTVTVNVCDAVT